jgi:RNA polymerase sigma factor (sigma-70 family)
MATAQMDMVIRHLRGAVLREDAAGWTDGQLLASFIEQKDEAAFEALVRRHGPMVFGVCRRVVRNHHDAEDAFQATFLVLARKASSVRPRERLANWLHGVALRTAMKARTMTAKRRGREKQITEMPEPEAAQYDQWHEAQHLIDQELNGLPENYRLPILLCDLEGKTIKEAAQQLGWPQGTLAGRLARGRKLLTKRLANRGVVLSVGSLAAVVSQNGASAVVPTALMSSTVKAATTIAAGQATVAGVVPAKVAVLMDGVMKAMLIVKLKTVTAVFLVIATVGVSGGLLSRSTTMAAQTADERPPNAAGEYQPSQTGNGSLAFGVGVNSDAPPTSAESMADTPRTDLDRLQGVWSVVSIEHGGKPSTLEKAVFMVDGKRACWQTGHSEIEGGLYLESSRKPKTYDLATTTRTTEGIYSLDGDTLRLCYDMGTEPKRPSGFITEKGSQQVLMLLKRTHGREVFPFFLADGTRAFPKIIETATTPPSPIAPPPVASTPPTYNEAERTRNNTIADVSRPQVGPRPPEVASQREYVIVSRLLEAGPDEPKEVLRFPKLTVYEGQLVPMGITEAPQNLLAKVVADEKIKIGKFMDVRVRRLGGNKVRLVLSFERNEVEESSVSEIRVLGNSLQAIQDVELHKPVKMILQKDARGSARAWVEITVDQITGDEPKIPPPASAPPKGFKQ